MSKGSNTTRNGRSSTTSMTVNGGGRESLTIGPRILRNGEYVQEANLSERLYPNLGGLSPESSFRNELLSMQYSYREHEALKAKVKEEYNKSEEYNRRLRYNIDKGFTKAQTEKQKEAQFKAISERRKRNEEAYHARLKAIDKRIQQLEKEASTSQIWDFDKGRN